MPKKKSKPLTPPTISQQIKEIVLKLNDPELIITASLWQISKSDTLKRFIRLKSDILNSSSDIECLEKGGKLVF